MNSVVVAGIHCPACHSRLYQLTHSALPPPPGASDRTCTFPQNSAFALVIAEIGVEAQTGGSMNARQRFWADDGQTGS